MTSGAQSSLTQRPDVPATKVSGPRSQHASGGRICCWALALLVLALASSGRAADTVPPSLVSTSPPDDAQGVSTNTTVRFTFNEPMSVVVTPIDIHFVIAGRGAWPNWTPVWSGDKKTLSCVPLAPWPAGSYVNWRVGTNFADLAANWLPNAYLGSFQVEQGPGWSTNTWALFEFHRTDRFAQLPGGTPDRSASNGYAFSSFVELPPDRVPDSVRITLPLGQIVELAPVVLDGSQYAYTEETSDGAQFELRYRDGLYRFRVTEGTLEQTVPATYPPNLGPYSLVDLEAAQAIEPSQDFPLRWSVPAEATAEDQLQVSVEGTQIQSPPPGEPGALVGTATQWTLPAGSLKASKQYLATLTAWRTQRATNDAGVYVVQTGRVLETRFPLKTVAPPPPSFLQPILLPGNKIRIRVEAAPGTLLIIESSPLLPPVQWEADLLTTTVSGDVDVTLDRSTSRRFYRVRVP